MSVQSNQSVMGESWVVKHILFLHVDSKDSDQAAQMCWQSEALWFTYGSVILLVSHLRHITRKPVFGCLQPGKTQTGMLSYRLAKVLKFWIGQVQKLYHLSNEK